MSYGYRPAPAQLQTVEGCSHVLRQIGSALSAINGVPGRRTTEDQRRIRAECDRLDVLKEEVKAIRHRLFSDDRLRWERMFVHVAHEQLTKAAYDVIADEARERVAAQRRLAEGAGSGSALAPRAGGGGVRTRA